MEKMMLRGATNNIGYSQKKEFFSGPFDSLTQYEH